MLPCSQDFTFLNINLRTLYFENSTFGVIVSWSVSGLVSNLLVIGGLGRVDQSNKMDPRASLDQLVSNVTGRMTLLI